MTLSPELDRRNFPRLAAACLVAVSLLTMLAACVSIPAEQPKKAYTSIAFSPDEQTTVELRDETAEAWAEAHTNEKRRPPNVMIWDALRQKLVGELEGATHVLRMALVPGPLPFRRTPEP